MTGPALLLLGFAVTGRPATGSALLAGLTIAAAVGGGGPGRPGRAVGLLAVAVSPGAG
jgi:hypothetical protein